MTFVFIGVEIDNSWVAWKNQAKSLNRESVFWRSIFLLCRCMTAMIALYILFIQLIYAFPGPPISSLLSLSETPQPSQFAFNTFNTWPFSLRYWTFNTNWFFVCSSNFPLLFLNSKVFYIWSTICALTSEHKPGRFRTLPDVPRRNDGRGATGKLSLMPDERKEFVIFWSCLRALSNKLSLPWSDSFPQPNTASLLLPALMSWIWVCLCCFLDVI